MEKLKLGRSTIIHLDEKEHTKDVHLRISKEILDITPDVILFEFPRHDNSDFDKLNIYEPLDKCNVLIKRIRKNNKRAQGDFNLIFDSIEKIWSKNKQVTLFNFDAPPELTSEISNLPYGMTIENLVWNYLRERYMANFLLSYKESWVNKKVVFLCHNFHWMNVKFSLNNVSKSEIWNYYFIELAQREYGCKFESDCKLISYLQRNQRRILLKYLNLINHLK